MSGVIPFIQFGTALVVGANVVVGVVVVVGGIVVVVGRGVVVLGSGVLVVPKVRSVNYRFLSSEKKWNFCVLKIA